MPALTPVRSVQIAVGATLLGWLAIIFCDTYSLALPYFSKWALITNSLIIVVLAILSYPIYQWHTGKRKEPLNPYVASRTIALAQASMVISSIFAGWHLGVLVYLLPSWAERPVHTPFFLCLIAIVINILLWILSSFIQKWGMIKDEEE
ncbi:MAG: DUF3180 domain-containing protein [Micrococcaceae bacterium]